jgi:transketolase
LKDGIIIAINYYFSQGGKTMLSPEKIKELKNFAADIRIATIRQIGKRGFGHVGGAMSIAEMLSVLYGQQMNINPKDPKWEGRDWLVCSKGHAGPAVYAALGLKGFFPIEWLDTLNVPGTNLPSHVDRNKTPGIDMTAGSLGQGLSAACGIALGHKIRGKKNRVFCIIGDGESQEGQIWEAIMLAAQKKLDNLVLLIDDNKLQIDDATANINNLASFPEKLRDFHWDAVEIDGHDVNAINDAIEHAKTVSGKPSAIVANTIKGKDCPFCEHTFNHHINVTIEQMEETIAALEKGKTR